MTFFTSPDFIRVIRRMRTRMVENVARTGRKRNTYIHGFGVET
jgi:hypothetical protein